MSSKVGSVAGLSGRDSLTPPSVSTAVADAADVAVEPPGREDPGADDPEVAEDWSSSSPPHAASSVGPSPAAAAPYADNLMNCRRP